MCFHSLTQLKMTNEHVWGFHFQLLAVFDSMSYICSFICAYYTKNNQQDKAGRKYYQIRVKCSWMCCCGRQIFATTYILSGSCYRLPTYPTYIPHQDLVVFQSLNAFNVSSFHSLKSLFEFWMLVSLFGGFGGLDHFQQIQRDRRITFNELWSFCTQSE